MTTTITKSIRLTRAESEEIARLSERSAVSEAALMKKWVVDGLQSYKLELALQAYMQRRTDLRGGAELAGVSYNRFLYEVQAHHIVILEDDTFLDQLALLAENFGVQPLADAVRHVGAPAPTPPSP